MMAEKELEHNKLPVKLKKGDVFKLKGITVTIQDIRQKDDRSAKIVVYQYETPKLVGDSTTPE